MEPHYHGIPRRDERLRSPGLLRTVGQWIIDQAGEANDRAPINTDTSPRFTPGLTDRSGRHISTWQHDHQPGPRSVLSLPANYLRERQYLEQAVQDDLIRYRNTPIPVSTPSVNVSATSDPITATRQLQAELAQVDANYLRNHERSELAPIGIVRFDGDEFADSVTGDASLHPVSLDEPTSTHPENATPSINITLNGKRTLIIPSVEGFDHPILCSKHFTKPDESMTQGQFGFYAIREGWDRTIVTSYAAAWVRTADYKDLTRCAKHPKGISPKFHGYHSYMEAVHYLGWDPATTSEPPRDLNPRPPQRRPIFRSQPQLHLGDDPHDWCGTHSLSINFTMIDDDDTDEEQSSISSISPETARIPGVTKANDSVAVLTAELNRKMKANTDAELAIATNPAAKAAKREEAHRRILDKQRSSDIQPLEKEPDVEAIHTWFILTTNYLSSPHWCLADGTPIFRLEDSPTSSVDFQYRSNALARLLVGRLTTDGHLDVLDEFPEYQSAGHGVALLHAIREFLDPQTDQTALQEYYEFSGIIHLNGDTIKTVSRNIKRGYSRLVKAGFVFGGGADLKLFQMLKAVTHGAYSRCDCFQTFSQDIIQGKYPLRDLAYEDLVNHIHRMMISAGLVKSNKAVRVSNGHARHMDGGISPLPATSGSGTSDPWFGQTCLDELTARLQFNLTNCLFCRYPKNHANSHFMSACPRLKAIGYTVQYDTRKDARRSDRPSTNDPPPSGTDSSTPTKSKQRRDARKARLAKLKAADADPSSLPEPTNATPPPRSPTPPRSNGIGLAARVTGDIRDTTAHDDDKYFSFTVDAHESNINDGFDAYMPHLANYDHINASGHRVKCIGRADHCARRIARYLTARRTKVSWYADSACLDTGATGDMLNNIRHFGDDYCLVTNMFVYMGDGTPVAVKGIGTARLKIDGKVIILPSALHIPELDCNLLSITQHALRGQGCGYIAENGQCHMTFPTFSVSRHIPADGDPKFALQPLNVEDYTYADYEGTHQSNPLDSLKGLKGRLAFLRRVHKGRAAVTRTQKRQFIQHLKTMLKSGKCHDELLHDLDDALTKTTSTHTADKPIVKIPTTSTPTDITPLPPNYSVVESAKGSSPDRYSRYELETLFGGRRLRDYSVLSQLGTGIRINNTSDTMHSVGSLVNIHRGRRRKTTDRKTIAPLDLVGMDIGYGVPNGPGGHKYVLVLVDKCTSHNWVYGMNGTSGADIQEALWKFFIDAGGFPHTMQCDFDPRFIGGKAAKLLRAHGCRIRAAPLDRQSQNGLVERRWQILETMARTYLTSAKLPKRFWFWAVREASRRLNLLPVSSSATNPHDPSHMITPFEAFYGTKPDYRVLFPFGSIGSFRRPRDGCKKRNTFDSQGMLGIALGRSEFTNGMIFYNPTLDSFCTSADYRLDPHQSVIQHFPNIVYDGGLSTSVLSNQNKCPSKYNLNDTIYVKTVDSDNIDKGVIVTPPTAQTPLYLILLENGTTINAAETEMYTEGANPESTPSMSLGFFTPEWLKQDCKVTFLHDDKYKRGYLNLDADNDWEFVTRNKSGQSIENIPLLDLNYSWKHRIQENSLSLGWQENVARRCCGIGRHVSAANLSSPLPPSNLIKGLSKDNSDAGVWNAAYNEEYDGLNGLDTFAEISEDEYNTLVAKHGDKCKAIPTMNIFTVKKDKDGNPVRAKSRIVVLGNLERRIWDKADRYAPVITAASNRLLMSMAVNDGRIMKQGDCKNAFCQPTIPEDEITIVRPPKGCPRSKPGTYWRLQKTLYGLARSARHWFDTFSHILKDMGFESMPHDPCVFKCTPIVGEPPIYLGCYVDDFVYYSKSDAVEEWFENNLSGKLRVDFMGAVSWFLGCSYEWTYLTNGKLSCHISQQAYVDGLVDKFGLEISNPTQTPYRSGLAIDRIPRDDIKPDDKLPLVRKYQSLMGGLNWLVTCTRPDITVATNLLGRFNANPSEGHLNGAKHVLKYLKTTASYGIRYVQGHNPLRGHVSFPTGKDIDDTTLYTDSCWGPQDASVPKENDTRTCDLEEMHSIGGYYISRMGGPIIWGVAREKRISGSSCEAEVKSMDEGVKAIQFLRFLMIELGIMAADHTIPLLNDNAGAIDWTKTGGPTSKKTRHMNIREFRVAECQREGEVKCYWVPGKENPSDLFTKEHRDTTHFKELRDLMIYPIDMAQEIPTVVSNVSDIND